MATDGYNIHDYGDLVRVSVVFRRTSDTALVDPTAVKLTVKKPKGDLVTYTYGVATIAKDSTGNYHADISVDQSSIWYYRWWSTGTGQASEERQFEVRDAQAVE